MSKRKEEPEMIYKNTTNIPDKLVIIALAHSMPEGVEIKELRLRNKPRKALAGNWGRYYGGRAKITLNVPRVINPNKIRRRLYRKGSRYMLASRAEWLVMVLAHELRHAWQDQVLRERNKIGGFRIAASRKRDEIDAEEYEEKQLAKWREWLAGLPSKDEEPNNA